jgi:hypothetical protein
MEETLSVMTQLAGLATAAILASSAPQIRVDSPATTHNFVQRLDQIWMVTYVDEAGKEIVAQAKVTTGEYVPLIAADPARLESIVGAARDIATARNIEMRLVKFTGRLDVQEIRP